MLIACAKSERDLLSKVKICAHENISSHKLQYYRSI